MNFYCFMYGFSVALIYALALLKYANLSVTECIVYMFWAMTL